SMVFPVVKLAAALFVWLRLDATSTKARRYLGFMQSLGRWSMVDVFVVALSVVAIKVSLISDVEVHAGVYVFSAAIFLSILVMHWLERLIQRGATTPPEPQDKR
ncbi:MAG: paraquat-inducible protein A, partial [Pseudomonadota bacterium]